MSILGPAMPVPGRGLCAASPGAGKKSYYLVCDALLEYPFPRLPRRRLKPPNRSRTSAAISTSAACV